jgi:type I restriction enzyme S subunit
MAGDILPTPIKELIEDGVLFIGDGYRAKNSELAPSGLPFARVQNINNGFQLDEVDHFPVADLHRVGNKISEPGDVVFTSKGSVGRFAFVRDTTPRFVYSPQLCFWRVLDRRRINPQWLFYWMQSREYFIQFSGVAGQTDMADYVSLRDQRQMKIALPPLPEQRAIACILGALDDKIDLNRRMNRTLEAMARALFQSWFVDFDPVRAKLAGQAPAGLKPELAALFPDRLVEVEGREVPEGWRVGTVENLGNVVCGKTPPTTNDKNYGRDVPFVTIPDMHNKVFVTETNKLLSKVGASTQKTKYLPPYSICVSCIATPGLVTLTSKLCQTNQQINSVIPADPDMALYCYFALRELGDQIRSHGAGGSVLLNVNKGQFSAMKMLLPSKQITSAFQCVTKPIFERILSNEGQSKSLAALRDTLLPKLISGALRVADAERIVERCV